MEKKSLSQQTVDRLYAMIVGEGRFAPGEKLPSEVAWSRELGVSRTTLREAVRTLAARGVVEVRRGRGTFVSERVGELEEGLDLEALERLRVRLGELFELRAIFEPQIARLACRRATEEELADILAKGEEVEGCIRTGRDRTQADWAFHAAIVRAAHNEFMVRLMPIISQAVEAAVAAGGHGGTLAQDTQRDHALLMEFLRRRDGEGAACAMAIHMRRSMAVMELNRCELLR